MRNKKLGVMYKERNNIGLKKNLTLEVKCYTGRSK